VRSSNSNAGASPRRGYPDRNFVTALARGMAVLNCFDANRKNLGTNEIAEITKLPQPTVWRLCHTLLKLGYLVEVPASFRLSVGTPVLGLGQYALSSTYVTEMVAPDMKRLAKLTGAAVSLGVPEQTCILIVKSALGDPPSCKRGGGIPASDGNNGCRLGLSRCAFPFRARE
jgi:hypothetical protein